MQTENFCIVFSPDEGIISSQGIGDTTLAVPYAEKLSRADAIAAAQALGEESWLIAELDPDFNWVGFLSSGNWEWTGLKKWLKNCGVGNCEN